MPVTVLIASPERLATFQELDEFEDAIVFADTDALRALEAITRRRPDLVALDRVFATTSRGVALINRIKADPSLTSCEIRLFPPEVPAPPVPPSVLPSVLPSTPPSPAPMPSPAPVRARIDADDARTRSAAPLSTTSSVAQTPSTLVVPFPLDIVPIDEPDAAGPPPLDQRGTRGAPRYDMSESLEVLVDGNPAILVNLSLSGAQVVSLTILRPNQRIRLSLPDPRRPVRCSASVAWAIFEMPRQGPQYRAGLAFIQSDEEAIVRFIEAHKR